MSSAFHALAEDLEEVFARGVDAPLADAEFQALALRAFRLQFDACAPYRAFCEGRGATPDRVGRWEDVPAVPATAFKHLDFLSIDGPAEATFLTSGTTAGSGARGRHPVASLSLYRASLRPNFAAHVLPEGERLKLLSLIPPPAAAPESSLSTMMGDVADTLCSDTAWLAGPDGGTDVDAFVGAAEAAVQAGAPVLVAGTAFAFVHLLDGLAAAGARLRLPPGTRVMETGGFKGRSRVVSRDELYGALRDRLGIAPGRIVNEYGMTELLSQLYEPVLRPGAAPAHGERPGHVAPPWLRVRALEPLTLEPLAEGGSGVLAFFDLANAGSVSHVLTHDVGRVEGGRLTLHGRAAGAEPRGCSMAVEELLSATERLG